MRSGGMYHRIRFFEKVVVRDAYGASVDTWDYTEPTIETRGEIRYTGGSKTLSNEEIFYTKSIELIVRYRPSITETMKIQIDETNDLWVITYIEMIGRYDSLRLTIEKCNEGLRIITDDDGLLITDDGGDFLTDDTGNLIIQ
jgi:head-tail adaptor